VVLERENIFARSEVDSATGMGGFLKRLSNRLHATTRPHVLRHEFLFREGDPFRADLLDETERNLRALGILAAVVVAPIDTTADGRVAVRVATRESWTLETDVTFSLDAGGQSRWTVQLADKNFMGYGVTAGAGLGRDLASEYWNLWYRQRRVAGSGLTLGLDYAKRSEGHLRQLELSRPFYALDDAVGHGESRLEQRLAQPLLPEQRRPGRRRRSFARGQPLRRDPLRGHRLPSSGLSIASAARGAAASGGWAWAPACRSAASTSTTSRAS
jgi:hypothetical protein